MLIQVVVGLGYEAQVIAPLEQGEDRASRTEVKLAPLPKDAPTFFAEAMRRARKAKHPVVIDFGATWCAPCKALKEKTLKQVDVAAALQSVELIHVDLDEHPKLAKAYGVSSIPDVFFIDTEGEIRDRLRKYEAAAPFLSRLEDFLSDKPNKPEQTRSPRQDPHRKSAPGSKK